MEVKVKKLSTNAKLPVKSSEGASCFDVSITGAVVLLPGCINKVQTGLAFEVPEGYEMEIRPRSGLAVKGLVLVNSPGTIDSDFRGELVLSLTQRIGSLSLRPGDRVVQCKVNRVLPVEFVEVDEPGETKRGAKGLGSAGR